MKKKYYAVVILVIIGMILAISHYRSSRPVLVEGVTSINNTRPIKELKKLVISKGDVKAYEELEIAFFNVEYYEQDYLLYSIIMADKYNYPRAYFSVYYCLTSIFEQHKYAGKIDEKTKALALKYLKEGVDLNDGQSTEELSNLYMEGKYVPKDTILGKRLEAKAKLGHW